MSSLEGSYFFLIAIGIICLSLNLLRIALYSDDAEQLIIPMLIIVTLYLYLFISNYIAQQITDHNECIFVTAYNVRWYMAPLHVQKMILFLLLRRTKTFHILIGGIFVACMESAVTLLSTSISYFTVLYSMKK
ncbi:PREDICTED: odorant receptor 49b-like [Vollenhovia emeryi]|uniref:odorant receptor 49b-like n=1 Tax=Vollenhovia emeryi TaxID=411798 RepID=UPI0005F3DD40|nr:PREDICTED: odorant receptor 49b-like [Vollenhovia emeryi]